MGTDLAAQLAERLITCPGIIAVALGGSSAAGTPTLTRTSTSASITTGGGPRSRRAAATRLAGGRPRTRGCRHRAGRVGAVRPSKNMPSLIEATKRADFPHARRNLLRAFGPACGARFLCGCRTVRPDRPARCGRRREDEGSGEPARARDQSGISGPFSDSPLSMVAAPVNGLEDVLAGCTSPSARGSLKDGSYRGPGSNLCKLGLQVLRQRQSGFGRPKPQRLVHLVGHISNLHGPRHDPPSP